MAYYPQESLYKPYKPISTMGTLLGLHPSLSLYNLSKKKQSQDANSMAQLVAQLKRVTL